MIELIKYKCEIELLKILNDEYPYFSIIHGLTITDYSKSYITTRENFTNKKYADNSTYKYTIETVENDLVQQYSSSSSMSTDVILISVMDWGVINRNKFINLINIINKKRLNF